MKRIVSLAAVSLAAFACSSETGVGIDLPPVIDDNVRPPDNVEQTDVIVQVTTPKVDVLFNIDNSCSMSSYQTALTENFPFFIGYFLDSGLLYNVGVTSTDSDGQFGPNGSEGRLRNIANNRWIDPDTPNPVQVFTGMARMGTSGSADERGIQTTFECLELRRDRENSGFYRDDAGLHTTVVTDEGDFSRTPDIRLPEFIDWYDNLKREADERTFSSIIDPADGDRYRAVTNQIGGVTWDLNQGNFGQVLDRLGVQASGLKREYFLSQLPVESTIFVQVEQPDPYKDDVYSTIDFERAEYDGDGNLVNENIDLAWDYNEERNSISFVTFVPEALSRVNITYDLLAATQDRPLEDEGEAGEEEGAQ